MRFCGSTEVWLSRPTGWWWRALAAGRCPWEPEFTVADLASALAGQVVLVVGIRLGCINHALLSVESIARGGLTLSGWIANVCSEGGERVRENIDTLNRMIDQPQIAEIGYCGADVPQAESAFRLEPLGI